MIHSRVLAGVAGRVQACVTALANDVVVTTDGAGWIIDHYAREIADSLRGRLRVGVATQAPAFPRGRVVHAADGACFYNPLWLDSAARFHHVIGTWWHGGPDSIAPGLREAAARLAAVGPTLARVHVSCEISADVARKAGVPAEKVVRVPLGIDTRRFHPPTATERTAARRRLGIPDGVTVVGLFQKDGDGWGEGLEPKLIKGPDIFVDVMTRMAARHRVFALVPGPARGFVLRGLAAAGVPYRNDGQVAFQELAAHYHACDLYIVPGREEGGPAAVLECLATATPLVSHRVGMAADVIEDGENGFVTDVGDVDGLVRRAERVITDRSVRARIQEAGLKTVQAFAWPALAPRYEALYAAVLGERGSRRARAAGA
jgi:glycosyltransferase involved in cell wall biosynthesis